MGGGGDILRNSYNRQEKDRDIHLGFIVPPSSVIIACAAS